MVTAAHPQNTNASFVYVTLLTNDAYLPGALVLCSSIRASLSRYPFYCLTTPNALSENALNAVSQAFDAVIEVPMLRSSNRRNLELLGRTELDVTFTKLHVFNPEVTSASRVCFLDADTMCTRSMDPVFTYLDGDAIFGAAPDVGWPDCFNSGMFVCKPSKSVFDELVSMATNGGPGSFDGGDQGLLNSYFSSWGTGQSSNNQPVRPTARVPFTYNVTPTPFYSYLPALMHFMNDISLVHFIGATKPWQTQRSANGGVQQSGGNNGNQNVLMQQYYQRWWALYDSIKHFINAPVGKRNTTKVYQAHSQQQQQATSGGPQHSYKGGAMRGASPNAQQDIDDFSNYRCAWDATEAAPLGFGGRASIATQSPIFPPLGGNEDDDTHAEDAEEDVSPRCSTSINNRIPTLSEPSHSTGKGQDLGNYRVAWNSTETSSPADPIKEAALGKSDNSAFSSRITPQVAPNNRASPKKGNVATAHV